MKELTEIQNLMKVNKSERNSYSNYNYRTAEAITHALKPHLLTFNCSVYFKDRLIINSNNLIIKSILIFKNNETKEIVYGVGYAGIDVNTKGMHLAQCYGASTTYARKSALQGLLLLDDSGSSSSTGIDSKYYGKANQNMAKANVNFPKANQDIANKIENKPYFTEDNFKKAYELKTTFDEIRKYYILPEDIKQRYLIYISEQENQFPKPFVNKSDV